jgi:hypothetical protein
MPLLGRPLVSDQALSILDQFIPDSVEELLNAHIENAEEDIRIEQSVIVLLHVPREANELLEVLGQLEVVVYAVKAELKVGENLLILLGEQSRTLQRTSISATESDRFRELNTSPRLVLAVLFSRGSFLVKLLSTILVSVLLDHLLAVVLIEDLVVIFPCPLTLLKVVFL